MGKFKSERGHSYAFIIVNISVAIFKIVENHMYGLDLKIEPPHSFHSSLPLASPFVISILHKPSDLRSRQQCAYNFRWASSPGDFLHQAGFYRPQAPQASCFDGRSSGVTRKYYFTFSIIFFLTFSRFSGITRYFPRLRQKCRNYHSYPSRIHVLYIIVYTKKYICKYHIFFVDQLNIKNTCTLNLT